MIEVPNNSLSPERIL